MSRRALVVDDCPATRRSVERVLADVELGGGFRVDAADSGPTALATARARGAAGERYDVAFVDIGMQPMDGYETSAALEALDPGLPVVLFSAQPRIDPTRCAGDRLLLVLKKPVSAIEIQQTALALAATRQLMDEERMLEEELERRVADKTQELEQARAALEREAAERSKAERALALTERLRFVGELASDLAVELNSPLQYVQDAIVVLREMQDDISAVAQALDAALARDPDSTWARDVQERAEALELEALREDLEASLSQCKEGVARVADITDALKQLAEPELAEADCVDLSGVVTRALTLTRGQYKYCARLTFEDEGPPPVPGDPAAIQQVVINLIVNASHAMEDRATDRSELGELHVRVYEEPGGAAAVRIEDTGGGIPDEIRERIYEPFFTTKEVGRGTGQGLAIARSIVVERHRGELRCETEPGVGTAFTVVLRAAESKDGGVDDGQEAGPVPR